MSQAVLQILLILAYLAIGLIAVTFPIYAISVNYLPQEKSESEKDRKKRIERLRKNITKLTSELSGGVADTENISQMTEQLERYKTELEGSELRADYLTAKGGVRNPIISLVLALLIAGIGIYFWTVDELWWVILLGLFSGGFSVVALNNLYKTISAVEYAALRPARTVDFNTYFREGDTTSRIKQMRLGEEAKMNISVISQDDDIENLRMLTTIPQELEIAQGEDEYAPGIEISHFPHCTTVMVKEGFLPKALETGFWILCTPKKVGKHPVEISVCGKGTYEIVSELTVRVVKGKSRTRKRK